MKKWYYIFFTLLTGSILGFYLFSEDSKDLILGLPRWVFYYGVLHVIFVWALHYFSRDIAIQER